MDMNSVNLTGRLTADPELPAAVDHARPVRHPRHPRLPTLQRQSCGSDVMVGRASVEGVDDEGFIVSGAAVELIPPLYSPVLETCVATLAATIDGLVSIYLYGSVATGRASPPESDLDLLVVTHDDTASDDIKACAANLTTRFSGAVHDVGIGHVTVDELFADNLDALGNRCFIKHYCLPVHGDDLRPRLPSCRPSATLAWAFNHNTEAAIDRARKQLNLATTGDEVQAVCRAAARKVLLAAASLTSVVTSSWTTDRTRAATFIADAYPEWAHDATVGLAWTRTPTDDSTAVQRFLDGFATWVAQQLQITSSLR